MLGIWISCQEQVKNRRIILFSLTAISRQKSSSDKPVKSSLEKRRSVCYFLCVPNARTPFLSQFPRKGRNSGRGSPVPGVQIVERGRKIHQERKNEGRLEGERGREFSRSCPPLPPVFRLRVVPHFSSGIVERAKRERAWKSPYARKGDTRVTPFLAWGDFHARSRILLYYLWGKMGDYS